MSKKIIIAGHICLDITPAFASQKEESIATVLKPGQLVEMEDVTVSLGGAVSNTGLGLKTLGADVVLMGKIGNDDFGRLVLSHFKKYGAECGVKISDSTTTSYSVVIAVPGSDRIFLHNPGANNDFSMEDLDFSVIEQACLFHFGYPPLMKRMYENGGEELQKMYRRVKGLGLLTSLDMAAVDERSDAAKVDWKAVIQGLLPDLDFFVPSLEELSVMLGTTLSSSLSLSRDIKPLGDMLMAMGAKVVLIKCGAAGLYLRTGAKLDKRLSGWESLELFEESYTPRRVRAATGAGDTAIAAFLKAAVDGCTPEHSLQLAAATGACCVEEYDAISGLKSFPELEEKISSGWGKQHFLEV